MEASGGEGDDHLVGGSADDRLDGGAGYNKLNGGDGSNRLFDRGQEKLRPTLLVVIHGFEIFRGEALDRGYGEWSQDYAKTVAIALEESGSQTLTYLIDWDSTTGSNTDASQRVADEIKRFLGEQTQVWDILFFAHSRGAIFAKEVGLKLSAQEHLGFVKQILLDPTGVDIYHDQSGAVSSLVSAVSYDDEHALQGFGIADGTNVLQGTNYISVYLDMRDNPTQALADYQNATGTAAKAETAEKYGAKFLNWWLGSKVPYLSTYEELVIAIVITAADAVKYHLEITPWYLKKSQYFTADIDDFIAMKGPARDFITRHRDIHSWRPEGNVEEGPHYVVFNAGPVQYNTTWQDVVHAVIDGQRYANNHDLWVGQYYVDGVLDLIGAVGYVLSEPDRENLTDAVSKLKRWFDGVFTKVRALNDDLGTALANDIAHGISQVLSSLEDVAEETEDPLRFLGNILYECEMYFIAHASDAISAFLATLLGPQFDRPKVTIHDGAIDVTATARLPFGGAKVTLTGGIAADGTMRLVGHQNVGLGGLSLTSTTFVVDSKGSFTFTATVDFGHFKTAISGAISKNGHIDFEGRAFKALLGTFDFSGKIKSSSAFELNASLKNDTLLNVSLSKLTLTNSGMTIKASNPLLGSFTLTGTINTAQKFNLTASLSKSQFGVSFQKVTLKNNALEIHAKAPLLGEFDLRGYVKSARDFSLSASIDESAFGLDFSKVVLTDGGLEIRASLSGLGSFTLTGVLRDRNNHRLQATVHNKSFTYKGISLRFPDIDIELEDRKLSVSGSLKKDGVKFSVDWKDGKVTVSGNIKGSVGGVLSSAGNSVKSAAKKVFNGILSESIVFFDANKNGALDDNEAWAYTNSTGGVNVEVAAEFDTNGNGVLDDSEGQWVTIGGIDISTGLVVPTPLIAPATSEVVSPLTTFASLLSADGTQTFSDATYEVLRALGLPTLDITHFDPIARTLSGDPNGPLEFAAHARLQDTVAEMVSLFSTIAGVPQLDDLRAVVMDVLGSRIKSATTAIDFGDATTIESLLRIAIGRLGVVLNDSVVAAAAMIISATNREIGAVPLANDLAYLERIGQIKSASQGAVARDLAQLAVGQIDVTTAIANNTGVALSLRIAGVSIPPIVKTPIAIEAEATGPYGAQVGFDVSANDLGGQALATTSTFLSGSVFPLGETNVDVSTTDPFGKAATSTFTITVVDTVAPVLVGLTDIVVEATGPNGAVVNLPIATATDLVDPSPSVAVNASSGLFPIGTTAVTFTASDYSGNTRTQMINVIVVDTTAPTIELPANIIVRANLDGGAMLTLPAITARDLVDPSPLIELSAESEVFPLGTTFVTVTATDSSGNTSTGTFAVTVVTGDSTAPLIPVITHIDQIRLEGTSLHLAGEAIDPGSASAATFAVFDWAVYKGDTISAPYATGHGIGVSELAFTPDDDGTYRIVLTVSQTDRLAATAEETISVGNVAPAARIISISSIRQEGTTINVEGSATDAGATDNVTLAWSVLKESDGGDDIPYQSGAGSIWSFTPNDNGVYRILLTGSDDSGDFTTVEERIIVDNLAPTLTVFKTLVKGIEGTVAVNTGTFDDVHADPVTLKASLGAVTDNGDGTWSWALPNAFSAGTTFVTITATDKDGGEVSRTFSMQGVSSTLVGDLNLDGSVNSSDVELLERHWGEAGPLGDANGDGAVDIQDLTAVANHWLQTLADLGGGDSASLAGIDERSIAESGMAVQIPSPTLALEAGGSPLNVAVGIRPIMLTADTDAARPGLASSIIVGISTPVVSRSTSDSTFEVIARSAPKYVGPELAGPILQHVETRSGGISQVSTYSFNRHHSMESTASSQGVQAEINLGNGKDFAGPIVFEAGSENESLDRHAAARIEALDASLGDEKFDAHTEASDYHHLATWLVGMNAKTNRRSFLVKG